MKSSADRVLARADDAHAEMAHEGQWGAVVSQVLFEAEMWQGKLNKVVVLNV